MDLAITTLVSCPTNSFTFDEGILDARGARFSFVVSSDYMHLAVLTVPVAAVSEFETHDGDEIINVLEGELCENLCLRRRKK